MLAVILVHKGAIVGAILPGMDASGKSLTHLATKINEMFLTFITISISSRSKNQMELQPVPQLVQLEVLLEGSEIEDSVINDYKRLC